MDNTTSQSLATESFSFSWLESQQQHKTISNNNNNNNNNNHSLLLDENQTTINNNNFNFDISNSKLNSSSLVHADKLFSNGLILPQFLNQPSSNTNKIIIASSSSSSGSLSPSPPLLVNSRVYHHRHHHHPSSSFRRIFMGKWSKLIPRKIFRKYVKCLVPIKESIGMGGGTRVDDVNRLALWQVASSPKKEEVEIIADYSSTKYTTTWSDIDESSIRDAILYCKRSSGLC